MNKKFIITTDENSANILEKAGFILINNSNNKFVFLNDVHKVKLLFNKLKDYAYTDTLFL